MVIGKNVHVSGFVYYRSSNESVFVEPDGHWSTQIQEIGEGDKDIGTPFDIAVVLADAGCTNAIANAPIVDGVGIVQNPLPAGCNDRRRRFCM